MKTLIINFLVSLFATLLALYIKYFFDGAILKKQFSQKKKLLLSEKIFSDIELIREKIAALKSKYKLLFFLPADIDNESFDDILIYIDEIENMFEKLNLYIEKETYTLLKKEIVSLTQLATKVYEYKDSDDFKKSIIPNNVWVTEELDIIIENINNLLKKSLVNS